MSPTKEMSLANIVGTATNDKQYQDIMKKFQWAVKRVTNENGPNEDPALTPDELIQLIKSWEPQRDIICLYVRWARQLKRNFNLDSIATLLCLSRQCNYTPVNFLRKVKTLSIRKTQKACYGITFHFDIPNRKDINRERLNKEFLGLSVTLALLQEQVTVSPSTLGKTGMRQSSPRTAYPINIPLEDGSPTQRHATVVSHPNVEFHTQSSLLNRIWISINHRWLAVYLIEHLFREPGQPWSYQDALVYSFQMMAPCGPCRFEFLSPLVGYCLRFPTQDSIDRKRSLLKKIWDDPPSFFSYGITCLAQFSTPVRTRSIISCFQDLRSDIPETCKQISYHRDSSWFRRWTMLRAYILHFWLESTSNNNIKALVTDHLASNSVQKKRKIDSVLDERDESRIGPNQLPDQAKHSPRLLMPQSNGLQSITKSRRQADQTSQQDLVQPTVDLPEQEQNKSTTCLNIDWSKVRLITQEEMRQFVQSFLLINRDDGINLLAELSPLEVYSANHLHDLTHRRMTGKYPFHPTGKTGPVILQIGSEADCFIDASSKIFHVARETSECFLEHGHHLPSLEEIQRLCQAIVTHGTIDTKRAPGQYRVNIGNGGQNWTGGAPCKLHGMQFEKDLELDGQFNVADILQTIGRLSSFTWKVICGLQKDATDHQIAPDSFRKQLYASHLNKYLSCDPDVAFEDLTLVVSSLYPVAHEVTAHKDIMNDTIAGYTRTGAFNMVMINDVDAVPTVLHFQILCNFRKVIGHYVLPFYKYIRPIAVHARQYLDKWDRSMHDVYGGKSARIPTAYDRSSFFLDDTLEYATIAISMEGKHLKSISSEYLLTEINVSRTLSLSMFINPIVKLRNFLKLDQTIELAFACSFLSNPFWFDWSMSTIIQRHDDPNDQYKLGLHPFYDWSRTTIEIFGTWQGGPYNRWSPCGGTKETVIETFGAQLNATPEERKCGETKLSQVISVLCTHVEWINSMSSYGDMPMEDMPLESLKRKSDETIKKIATIASCQFSHFRLGILTTILSGCGLLKPGKHLRQLMYPVKGSASFKHLSSPVADYMSPQRARAIGNNEPYVDVANDGHGTILEEQHDVFMQYLSSELGFKVYLRDEIDCILCESHPMRSLNCRDWFRKGMTIFDGNEFGQFFYRDYGRGTKWMELLPPQQYEFAYVGRKTIQYIPVDALLSYYAADFGNELRNKSRVGNELRRVVSTQPIKFKGRDSRTSGFQRTYSNNLGTNEVFPHPSMKMADFYMGSYARRNHIQSMFVLADAESAVETSYCNNLERYRYGKLLYDRLKTLPIWNEGSSSIAAACYHMDTELNSDQVTFFPGHVDKPFVHTAWFVPIGKSPFFTIISVSSNCQQTQDQDSLSAFNEWKERISSHESRKVSDFIRDFEIQAKKRCGNDSSNTLIYLSKPGSVLSFPANMCYHATIIPKKPVGYPRDLLVFHPLDGNSNRSR